MYKRQVYYKIQEEIARRSSLKKAGTRKGKTAQGVYSSKYALTGIMVCNECGAHYRKMCIRDRYNRQQCKPSGSRMRYSA